MTEVLSTQAIETAFARLEPDPSWAFAELTTRQTRYLTHAYHSYPAKFIPQLARRLIEEFSKPGDLVLDPFMGSGTTLVEAKLSGRPSAGVDINPVAHLISVAKTTAVPPDAFQAELRHVEAALAADDETLPLAAPDHERIDYWFPPESKRTLARILALVESAGDPRVRALLRCAFSNSLKTSSIWLQRSTKPTRDFKKKIPDPRQTFLRQARQMQKRNAEFYEQLAASGFLDTPAEPHCADARDAPVDDGSVALVVTSPPYVTSYEYADLHQLTALWFRYMTDLPSFRKRFIGTAHREPRPARMESELAERIVERLGERRAKTAAEVAAYFTDMREVFEAMKRKLKRRGRACVVVGNTNLLGVDILNAQVFAEQMARMGFELERVIEREIPSKILPQVRDKKTGRFTAKRAADYQAYPREYILVMRKR